MKPSESGVGRLGQSTTSTPHLSDVSTRRSFFRAVRDADGRVPPDKHPDGGCVCGRCCVRFEHDVRVGHVAKTALAGWRQTSQVTTYIHLVVF